MSAPVDIRGQKFGELTAIEPTDKRRGSYIIWRCRCSCGKEVFATAKDLRAGNTKSCGHILRANITGQRFGRLTAIEPTDRIVRSGVVWRCICDCGNETFVTVKDLRSGNTKSCGCLNHERRPLPANFVDGTRISMLSSTPPKTNTSGVRGVSWSKQKQDWEAYIKFKGVLYHLGHYKKLEDAAKARARAEEAMYEPKVEEWKSQNPDLPAPVPVQKNTSPRCNIYADGKTGSYRVRIRYQGKMISLGTYHSLHEAIDARDQKREELGMPPIPHE